MLPTAMTNAMDRK